MNRFATPPDAATVAARKDRLFESHPGLREALQMKSGFALSLACQLDRWGKLSPKQIQVAVRIYREQEARKAEWAKEPRVPAPVTGGRVAYEGKIIAVKQVTYRGWESYWGMTVRVNTPQGCWFVFSSVPQALIGTHDAGHAEVVVQSLKGVRVRLEAKLEHGHDAHFAFGKRPTLLAVEPDDEEVRMANAEMAGLKA